MAVTQTQQDKKGWSQSALEDSDGYSYHQFGSVRWYVGAGTPEAIITAPRGSIYIRNDSGAVALHVNDDAATSWPKPTLS